MKPVFALFAPIFVFTLIAGDVTYDLKKMVEPPAFKAGESRHVLTRSSQMIDMEVEAGEQKIDVPNKEVTLKEFTFKVVAVDEKGIPTRIERDYTRAYTRTSQQGLILHPYSDRDLVFTSKDGKWEVTVVPDATGKAPELNQQTRTELIKEMVQLDDAYQLFLSLLPAEPVKLGASWPITGDALKKLAFKMAGEDSSYRPDLQNSRFEARLETVTDRAFTLEITGKLYLGTDLQPGLPAMLEIDQKFKQVIRRGPFLPILEELAGTGKISGGGKQGQVEIIVTGGGFITAESRMAPLTEANKKALADNRPTRVDAVYRGLGFDEMTEEMIRRIATTKTGLAAILSEEDRKRFAQGLDAAFTPEKIRADLTQFLAMEMDRAHEAEILKWLETPVGKDLMQKMRALNTTAQTPEFQTWTESVTEDDLQKIMPSMSVLLKEQGSLQDTMDAVVSVTSHLVDVINVVQPGRIEERRKQMILNQTKQTNAADLEIGSLTLYAYLMRDVPRERLDEYVAFAQSALGMWHRDLTGNAMLYAYARRFEAVKESLSESK
ncbi:MAG: DUF2059 domain-containing protein [Acidobacteriota bacterium]|nr:DUF2059 domain-containing protein [Acidobacteriota bacterium]